MRKMFFICFICLTLLACSTLKTEYAFVPENEVFLSLVRYILSDEEKDMYNQYPPLEREEFIEKFWARRDPTPYTARNEFKEQYFNRIREANKMFRGAIAGWLQDRGRIYILLGPPNERIINPGGRPIDGYAPAYEVQSRPSESLGEKPSETWVYYNLISTREIVKIDFADIYGTGDLKLATNVDQLVPVFINTFVNPNLYLIHEIAKQEAEARRQNELLSERTLFNFNWDLIKEKNEEKDSNLTIQLEIPFERIIFQQEEDYLISDMDLFIEIKDADQNFIWDYKKTHQLSFSRDQFNTKKDQQWILKIPVTYLLSEGEYSIYIHLINLSAEQDVKKLIKLKM
jgi:GWxTD domain-containing protein